MAYTWTDGELITAEKLNNTGGGGVLAVNANYDESTATTILDKTWKEINDAFKSGTTVLCKTEGSGITTSETTVYVLGTNFIEQLGGGINYGVYTLSASQSGYTFWYTDSETGYPRSES